VCCQQPGSKPDLLWCTFQAAAAADCSIISKDAAAAGAWTYWPLWQQLHLDLMALCAATDIELLGVLMAIPLKLCINI